MKEYLNKYQPFVIALLIIIILVLWYSRNSYNREYRLIENKIKDSLANLQTRYDILEIEDYNKAALIEKLTADKKALQIASERSKAVKVKVLSQPKIIVPDSIVSLYAIVSDRLLQDESKIEALEVYASDLEHEVFKDGIIIAEQKEALKVKDTMLESKDLMAGQMDARHKNNQKKIKDGKRKNRKLKTVIAGAVVVWVVALLI